MKEITLDEAYKRATKGPLHAFKLESPAGDDKGAIIEATDTTVAALEATEPPELASHDAALLCHAFNVLPEVVEALTEWKNHKFTRPISDHPEAIEQRRIYDLMTAALAKAQTVKLP